MNKVLVIGCPGSGKSTFSRELHRRTDIPLFYLDMMYWNADKTVVDKRIFLERLDSTLKKDRWIIDGNYGSTMEKRMRECDTVILLDYPVEVCLRGVRERRGKPRDDMPWIETEEDDEFMEYIRRFNAEQRPRIIELIEAQRGKNVLIFTARAQADAFLRSINT